MTDARPDPAALPALADRCEAAEGADRGLDGEIVAALGATIDRRAGESFRLRWPDGSTCVIDLPTASVDACLMLHPIAAPFTTARIETAASFFVAGVGQRNSSRPSVLIEPRADMPWEVLQRWRPQGPMGQAAGVAATIPLAYCAAILRAVAATRAPSDPPPPPRAP